MCLKALSVGNNARKGDPVGQMLATYDQHALYLYTIAFFFWNGLFLFYVFSCSLQHFHFVVYDGNT